jgi:hypothetical protein
MPYRGELEALRVRVASLMAERDDALEKLARARASLRSVLAEMGGLAATEDVPWRSLPGGEPVAVRFVNATDDKLELRWIGYEGQVRGEGTLVPGGEREVMAYAAHLYRVVDAASRRVVHQGYVRASAPTVVIERPSE